MIRILAAAERESLRRLASRLNRAGGLFTTARLRLILREIEGVLWELGYQPILDRLLGDLSAMGDAESKALAEALESTIPADIFAARPELAIGLPESPLLRELARTTFILDHPLGDYFKRTGPRSLVAKEIRRYRRIIQQVLREGLVLGDVVEEMVRRIKRQGFTRSRLHLRTIVDSAVKANAQRARMATMKANAGDDGVVKGFIWDSTLDTRTTPQWCIPRNRKRWTIDLEPRGHKFEWGAGPGAIHPRCRSNAQAWLKSWRELGIPAKELSGATKASMSGPVPRETHYFKWLEQQSEARWAQVFGKRRARAIAEGRLSFEAALAQMGARRAA